jgi:hypothetical protein
MTTPRLSSRVARGGRLSRLGILTVLLLCVALAAPVFAYVSVSKHGVIIPKHGSGSATVSCRGKQHIAFGGLIAQFDVPHDAIVFPTGMRKSGAGKWTATGSSLSTSRGSRLASVAYCGDAIATVTRRKTATVESHRSGAAVATCPAGTVVVGGGFATKPFPFFEDVKGLERLTARTWRATILNIGDQRTTITAIAYCGHGAVPVMRSHSIKIRSGAGGTVRARCPRGKSLLFGGEVAAAPGVADRLPHVFPFSLTAETKTRWAVKATNGGGKGGTLTALAYCR